MSGLATSADEISDRQRSAAFVAVAIAFVLEVADSTIVNTALPVIKSQLGGGESAIQWIAASYFLTLGCFLLIGGRLGDIFGHRRIFLLGIGLFTLASCLCGIAFSAEQLVAARLLQGAAGALMAPQVMAIVQLLFSPIDRVAKLAWFGVLGGVAAVLGPILGGVLIDADIFGLGWRMIFLINLPVGLLALAVSARFIPRAEKAEDSRIDYVGAVLFIIAFALLILGLIEGPELGWPIWSVAAICAGLFTLGLGWKHARRHAASGRAAIIAPDLFRLKTFLWGMLAVGTFAGAASGFLLVFAVSLQQGLGLTALETAIRHIPFGLGVMVGISLIGRRYLPRFGKWLIVSGAVIIALAGSLAFYLISTGNAGGQLFALLGCAGIGMGMVMGPLPPVIVAEVERSKAGTASAMMRTAQQIGGAVGIALIGAAYFSVAGVGPIARLEGLIPATASFLVALTATMIFALRLPRDIFRQRAS